MESGFNRIKEWRRTRGLTLQQLADACGTSKSQIDKLEKGDRRLTVDWMVRLAKPLNCDPRELLPDGAVKFEPVAFGSVPNADTSATLPVRGVARGGQDQEMFLSDGPIDQIPRPYYLTHARDAYAIYVVGDSMTPMYRPRQLLFVNPYKPPSAGGGVVVVKKNNAVLIKEFVRQKTNEIILREYQPQVREFAISSEDIASLHTVVGATEPV